MYLAALVTVPAWARLGYGTWGRRGDGLVPACCSAVPEPLMRQTRPGSCHMGHITCANGGAPRNRQERKPTAMDAVLPRYVSVLRSASYDECRVQCTCFCTYLLSLLSRLFEALLSTMEGFFSLALFLSHNTYFLALYLVVTTCRSRYPTNFFLFLIFFKKKSNAPSARGKRRKSSSARPPTT